VAVWGMPALAPGESAALEHDYRHHPSRLVRQRSHLLLLCAELESQAEVARVIRCSLDTVQRTLNLYRAGGRLALRERRGVHRTPGGQRRTLTWQKALALAMEAGPAACGVPRPTWTAPLLATHLFEQTGIALGERSVRRGLASLGYVCRRGTWTVRHKAEEHPDYLPKRKGSWRS
jgi:transposase